jgi:SGNH hydrolase-like domain, acetyltransferase AlgX
MTTSFRWQPGQLIPILILLSLLAEAGTRFLPPASVSTRGTWEGAIRYSFASDVEGGRSIRRLGLAGRIELAIDPRDQRQGSFEINLNLENRHAFGNLASIGNLPAYRDYHVEDFTTDEFGFPNRPERSANRTPDAIVVGSSYIAQPGVVHEETLPALLAARSSRRIYNAGSSGRDPVVLSDLLGFIRRTARRLGMDHGLVILDYKYGEDRWSIPPKMPDSPGSAALTATEDPVADAARPWAAALRRWLAISRLQILAQRTYKSLQNDWLLPNVHSNRVLLERLPDGKTMLFLPTIVKPRPGLFIESGTEYFKWLNAQLARDGLTLVVLFVPRPAVIYGDLVTPPLPAEEWLARYRALQSRLEAEGIAVVNPIESLRREARIRLARGEYIYQLDDTHWNAQGIAITVDEILRVLPSTDRAASLAPVPGAQTVGTAKATSAP